MTVIELVERERHELRRLRIMTTIAVVVAFTCGVLALGSLVFGGARWMALPRALPFLAWLLIVAGDLAIILTTIRWLDRRATRSGVAMVIEQEQALRTGALRGVLEIAAGVGGAEVGALGRHAANTMSARLEHAGPRLTPLACATARRRLLRVGAAAIVAIALLGAAAPAFGDGLRAILRPDRAWTGTLLGPITFTRLPRSIMRGEQFRLSVSAPGRRSLTLLQRAPGEAWQSAQLTVASASGIASTVLGPVRGDLHLVVSDGRSSTDTVLVRVTDRPFVTASAMRAIYPAYLDRASEPLPVGEPVSVPYGTIVELSGRASSELLSVALTNGRESMPLGVSGQLFSGQFEAKRPGLWQWVAVGPQGVIPDVPPSLELDVIPDSAPNVVIVSPSVDTSVASTDRITLQIGASDDHGLVSIALQSWRVAAGGTSQPMIARQLTTLHAAVWSGTADLDLASRGLEPGDALHVKVVATDNTPWAQRGESRELLLRIPTIDERRELARTMGDSTVAAAQAMAKTEGALQQRTQEMARDRGTRNPTADPSDISSSALSTSNPGDMSFESAEKTRALATDQKSLTDQVKQLQQGAKALEDQLRQAGALDSSLAHQLQEAQALLKDALTPELLSQMQKLDSSAHQLSRSDAQQSLKDLQAMQQRLREQLEKTAELLARAALEGSMQTLADEAKELANRDTQLADSLQQSARPATKEPDARQLADQTEHMSKAMDKLQDRLTQAQATAGATRAADAQQHAAASEEDLRNAVKAGGQSGAQQQQSAGAPPVGQSAGAADSGRSMEQNARAAASQMQQSAQAMKDARDAQIQSWKLELTSVLDESIQDMLQLSRQETGLQHQIDSGQTTDIRGEQSAIKQGVDDAAKRLDEQARKSALLSNRSQQAVADAEQKVQQAVQSSSSTNQQSGQMAGTMGDAAQALNQAAASLARDRQRVNTATSATGFAEMMQQLQQMANKQGALNSQAQSLLQIPGSQMSAQAQAAARELARQQRQIAQQLEELGDGPGGDRAAQLAQQARQVADALDAGQLNPATVARQQELFHKMLDAGRTLQQDEREDSDHREAKSATGSDHFTPTNTNVTGHAAVRYREPTWDELRGLSADDRRAILEYFQKINGHGP